MYLSKGSKNDMGQTGWRLGWRNPDNAGNMGTMEISVGILADEDGLRIGGKENLITWDELEAAKVETRRKSLEKSGRGECDGR